MAHKSKTRTCKTTFYRGEESLDGATGGARLGLSISRRAVPLPHGEITAENASPGLRVNIVIPAHSDTYSDAIWRGLSTTSDALALRRCFWPC